MIVVDGVVGVGKSTLMNILAERGLIAYEEPVVDNPILEKFYYDRNRYSFPLQVFFLNKRFLRPPAIRYPQTSQQPILKEIRTHQPV